MTELTPTQQLAEQAERTHYAVVTSEDPHVNRGDRAVYKHSQGLFLATIKAAYPDQDAEAVYDVWLDCVESVAYCVRILREQQHREQLTQAQARACLAAVEKQFASHITEGCRPALVQAGHQCSGWAIVWEDGPHEWALRAFHGGYDEETYQLAREAGFTPERAEDAARVGGVPCPEGVLAEPVMSFTLGLYPA